MTKITFGMAQNQSTRDAISQQVREQIEAARQEARAAASNARNAGPPPLPGAEGITIQPNISFDPNQGPPASVVAISIAFFVAVAAILIFGPLARAFARRMDRGGATHKVPAEVASQLTQLTQAVDAIAVEVERISEGQRFTTRLLSEQRGDQSRAVLSPVAGADRPAGS